LPATANPRLAINRICYNDFSISGLKDINAKPGVAAMVEFTSEPQKSFSSLWIILVVGVLVLLLGGVLLYTRHQRSAPPQSKSAAIVVEGLLRSGNTDFEYYKNKIRIENVKATLGISFNGTRTAMIAGIIVNDGSRKLEALEMHVTLYDMWGKLSKERTAFALRPQSGLSYKPMEPLERRTFAIGIESVEYYWNPKQIAYEITGLKYQ
jgi:hypothetical protein